MCHHSGDIPDELAEWTTEKAEPSEDDEELPAFLNAEEEEELSVLTDGGDAE